MSRRTGLILDFGGVLTTSVAACALAFELRTGLAEGALLTTLALDPRGLALYEDLERGAISQTEWNAGTGAIIGIDGTDLLARMLTDLHPEPRVIAAAQAARAAGVKVGILSNSLGMEPYNPYDGYELDRHYDAVLLSEHYKMRKPDPAIYQIMLDLMDLPGEACVFVDDTAHNLPPAEALGITTILAADPDETVARIEDALALPLT
jgi:putative hydrolase of the HAD superfamily